MFLWVLLVLLLLIPTEKVRFVDPPRDTRIECRRQIGHHTVASAARTPVRRDPENGRFVPSTSQGVTGHDRA